ncbi:MAG: aminotransferase class I/II-fold pyridoxal phosphate-dependent enzyme [Clostridiales Family XIII bacterium]|nr:aminotransferase class I/II-fold pyridoxal phosphate-dependent enzyme [Clostridiales Family XIII bacterium]
MINLMNDYNYTAHPDILKAVAEAPVSGYLGYGCDEVDDCARALVRDMIGQADADVHFLTGGTQTNLTAVSAFLRPHEAVIAADTAHISKHEAGAIEMTGHKVYAVKHRDGKVTRSSVEDVIEEHTDEHFVKPRMLYISQSTEYGTVYTKEELRGLRDVCDANNLLLYIDGARIGAAATANPLSNAPTASPISDAPGTGEGVTVSDIAKVADAVCVGGTKNGLLFGEALVINNPSLRDDMRFIIKQRGGLLAKGFLIGIQFEAILKDGLYLSLARKANESAATLRTGLLALGYSFEVDSPTNQVFPVVSDAQAGFLEKHIIFERWHKVGADRVEIRFVTTWRTTPEEIAGALEILKEAIGTDGGAR